MKALELFRQSPSIISIKFQDIWTFPSNTLKLTQFNDMIFPWSIFSGNPLLAAFLYQFDTLTISGPWVRWEAAVTRDYHLCGIYFVFSISSLRTPASFSYYFTLDDSWFKARVHDCTIHRMLSYRISKLQNLKRSYFVILKKKKSCDPSSFITDRTYLTMLKIELTKIHPKVLSW